MAAGAAALVILTVSYLLYRRGQRDAPINTPEEAAAAAEAALTGFVAADAVVGSDGRGALAVAADGRVVAIRRRGRRVSVREVSWSAIRATAAGMLVEGDERRHDELVLSGVDALDARRLAASGGRTAP